MAARIVPPFLFPQKNGRSDEMSHKLFENWTFSLKPPEPFDDWAEKYLDGKLYSSDVGHVSVHNITTKGKRATLHRPTIRAIEALCQVMQDVSGTDYGAVGVQKSEDGELTYYLCEFLYDRQGVLERTALSYHVKDKKLRGCFDSLRGRVAVPALKNGENDGRSILFLLAFASIVPDSPLFNDEFSEKFQDFREKKKAGYVDEEETLALALVLCDNLYRRINDADTLAQDGIPIDIPESKNIAMMTELMINRGMFSPNDEIRGQFQILKGKRKKKEKSVTLKEIGDRYCLNLELTEEEKAHVPQLPDDIMVSKYARKIAGKVKNTSMRVFMMRGESGTGKTTDCKVIAALLGMPYIAFTCSEGTDELELVSSIIPNTDETAVSIPEVPDFEDMMMDPATALSILTGEYREDVDSREAFEKMMQAMYQKGYEVAKSERDFKRVESSLIKGIRGKYVVEIQEATVIRKEGTLVKLNSLTDDAGSITMLNGETVVKDKDAIIIFTCNPRYRGCRKFNQSVVSRMRQIFDTETPTPEELTYRAMLKTGEKDRGKVLDMANCLYDIREYCRKQSISSDVCGSRELVDWVEASIDEESPLDGVMSSVLSKITDESEIQKEILDACVLTRFAS